MALEVLSAEFVKTGTRRAEWPAEPAPEVAFVGRSNVGKSSMLNALARRDGLARVSSTPGRTQALQFFRIAWRPSPAARPRVLRFCDLPGYGFAKAPRAERDRWGAMIEEYLRERGDLRTVVLIVDARHEAQASDQEALNFLSAQGRPVLVAATKMDKLAKSHRRASALALARGLGVAPEDVVPFSAVEGTGTDALWARIATIVRPPKGEAPSSEDGGEGEA
ncbi:MAG: ribosome biogenesis GTP-binding protein YihA/YsxC [Anaeromyxobacteraceae bacterium]